jgi:hypothetical protein
MLYNYVVFYRKYNERWWVIEFISLRCVSTTEKGHIVAGDVH